MDNNELILYKERYKKKRKKGGHRVDEPKQTSTAPYSFVLFLAIPWRIAYTFIHCLFLCMC